MKKLTGTAMVLLALFVVLATYTQRQAEATTSDAVLDQVLHDTEPIQDVSTEEAFALLLSRAHARGGIVEVETCAQRSEASLTKRSYMLSGLTLRQILDVIVAKDTRYKWTVKDSVVNLIPVNGIPEILKMSIVHFESSQEDSIEGVGAKLFNISQVKQAFAQRGMVKEDRSVLIIGGAPPKMDRSLALDDTAVIDILNAAVGSYKYSAVWHYTEHSGKCKQSFYLDWPVR